MVKVAIEGVALNLLTNSPVVILKSEKGEVLPIVVGIFEAQAILLVLEGTSFARPLTHDLMKNMMGSLGGNLARLEIHTLQQNIYYAHLVVTCRGGEKTIDCRPSDGIALALRCGAPVFAPASLLDKADIIKYYQGKDFLNTGSLEGPIAKKEAEEFRKAIEDISAKEFWKKLKDE